jgi:hypothetical protein
VAGGVGPRSYRNTRRRPSRRQGRVSRRRRAVG